ncbi:MAG: hypothetical protein Q7U57_08085 [Methylovulum sp.]|nr:hypothetical protein [Methylovulum sp.]
MSSNETIDYNSIHTPDFESGYDDAWGEYEPGEPVGDPVASENYCFGWWVGIGDAKAFHAGWKAFEDGVRLCPYVIGNDDDCFREPWLEGYWQAVITS